MSAKHTLRTIHTTGLIQCACVASAYQLRPGVTDWLRGLCGILVPDISVGGADNTPRGPNQRSRQNTKDGRRTTRAPVGISCSPSGTPCPYRHCRYAVTALTPALCPDGGLPASSTLAVQLVSEGSSARKPSAGNRGSRHHPSAACVGCAASVGPC
jgi:hypothetical protein